MREQFRVAIAPYVLDGAVSEEVGTVTLHGKRRASERLSSSPVAPARAPKRARVDSSTDHSDGDGVGVGVKREESVPPHLDLAAMLESRRRARDDG